MTEMKKHIYDESNVLWYELIGDYYIPSLTLSSEEQRPIGKWGRMHREYLKEHHPIRFNDLILSGQLWTYLADLNEQAQERLFLIIEQMKASEGVTEEMKAADQMAWVRAMNSIRNRAEEIILRELIYGEDMARDYWKNFGMAILSRPTMTWMPVKNIKKRFD